MYGSESSSDGGWISWFIELEGHEFFVEVSAASSLSVLPFGSARAASCASACLTGRYCRWMMSTLETRSIYMASKSVFLTSTSKCQSTLTHLPFVCRLSLGY